MIKSVRSEPIAFDTDSDLEQRLDAVVQASISSKKIVGAVVLVARDGKLVYRRAAGLADREANVRMRTESVFRLASVTKPLVAAAAMRLIEDGIMSLDDDVTRWLPDFRPRLPDNSTPDIRIRHLLSHSAGLSYRFLEPDGSPYHSLNISDGLDQPGLSIEENLRRLAEAPLAFVPGTRWRYSLATDVLGAVISKVSGESLPQLVRRLVTGPLGMADTCFSPRDRTRIVTPYADGSPEPVRMIGNVTLTMPQSAIRFAPDRAWNPASYPSGGAGMAGTAEDFLLFVEAVRNDGYPILSSKSIQQMMSDHVGSEAETRGPGWGYGFGWAVLSRSEVADTPQSEGTIEWGGAYGHSWFLDKAKGLSVIALTNTTFEGVNGAFRTQVRNAVYG